MNVTQWTLLIVKLLAGTGVFLVGVQLLTSNMEQLATGKMKEMFGKIAGRRVVNMGIGAAITALIQSSGVTTVLIVGFVNVGIMSLQQAAAMIMGANIGTTVTAQIAALSAFPITTYIQILIFVGIMMNMICKKDHVKKAGLIVAGLGMIFIGLALMSDSMKENKDTIQQLFMAVTNPFLLLLVGIFLTALVQSSSATTSIVIAMSLAGLKIGTGGNEVLYLILGTNIGSCVTALMSSLTSGVNAKRTSLIHLLFNTFGSAIFFVLLLCIPGFMQATFGKWFSTAATQVAMFHTFFNVSCTILFLPFCGSFVKLSQWLVKDKRKTEEATHLDERILSSASLAISQLENELLRLSDTAMQAFRTAYQAFKEKNPELIAPTQELIGKANDMYQQIINYLIRLSAQSKLDDERSVSRLHNNAGDIMRIAEIADNFTKYAAKEIREQLHFSASIKKEIEVMVERVEKLYELTRSLILEKDEAMLNELDQIEESIDALRQDLIDSYILQLNSGECTPEGSGVLINLVSNLERMGDHLTYIAHSIKE